MSGSEVLTLEEIRILEDYEKGISVKDIASKIGYAPQKVQKMIETALVKREKLQKQARERKVPSYIRVVDSRLDIVQKGTMKVGSQILKQLSEGIYTSPAGSLKELISNSYDSDATTVNIRIDEDEISVTDDGDGMDWSDFDRDFTFISYSSKQMSTRMTDRYKRRIIGFIGIGFISASELCDKMIIRSAKKDSDIFFEATIDFSKFRMPDSYTREFYEVSEYELVNHKKETKEIPKQSSFTEICLTNLRPGIKTVINEKAPFGEKRMTIAEIWKYISDSNVGITGLGRFWQMVLDIAMICPVKYAADGPVRNISNHTITTLRSELEATNFSVFLNGTEIFKPMVFPNDPSIGPDQFSIHPIETAIEGEEGAVRFRGYIYSQHGMINPKECIGILIRIRNVAVGGYDRNLLGYPSGANQLFRNWISGEIYIDEGLENAMNINRSTFKVSSPSYLSFQNWLHDYLDNVVFKFVLDEYYYEGRSKRQKEKAERHDIVLSSIVQGEIDKRYAISYETQIDSPVVIDETGKKVKVNPTHQVFRRSPSKYGEILQEIFVLLEISIRKSNGDLRRLRSIFQEEVEKWVAVK